MNSQWRAAPPADLLWVEWGEHCALYHRPSGKTHFVNDATARLLQQVLLEPSDVEHVRFALGLPAGPAIDAGSPDEIMALLQRLEALGLVARVGP